MLLPKEEIDPNEVKTINSIIIIFHFYLQEKPNQIIVVLGRGAVGKTSLIIRYINNGCPKEHDPTVEDAYTITIENKSGENREFKILDTAGEEDYQNMLDQWISYASGFILVFAINDLETFEALNSKVVRIQKNGADKLPMIIVGNKCDLEIDRKVSKEQAENYANSIGAKYYETSALTDCNHNVKTIFVECANMIINKEMRELKKPKKCCIII